MEAITANNLCKKFGKTVALDRVCFSVEENSIFGIIGPDGAGKSTLLKTLATLLQPDSGTAEIAGLDIRKDYRKIRKQIGYMPEIFSLYQDLTVEENLEFYASIFNVPIKESYEIIAPVFRQLEPFRRRMAGKLSGGMKQKLALSCALIHQPGILLLDEPTRGVDPVSRKEFWDILASIKQKGITVVLSTSYMDEAAQCDRIGFFSNGLFLTTGTPQEIISNYKKRIYTIVCRSKYEVLLAARQWKDTESCYINGATIHITFRNPNADVNGFKSHIHGITGEEIMIEAVTPALEDCFMEISKQKDNE